MSPKDYPVYLAALATGLTWLAARYGFDLDATAASQAAATILVAGSYLAKNAVRTRRSLPDPDATKANTVRVEPTTYRVGDESSVTNPLRPKQRPRE